MKSLDNLMHKDLLQVLKEMIFLMGVARQNNAMMQHINKELNDLNDEKARQLKEVERTVSIIDTSSQPKKSIGCLGVLGIINVACILLVVAPLIISIAIKSAIERGQNIAMPIIVSTIIILIVVGTPIGFIIIWRAGKKVSQKSRKENNNNYKDAIAAVEEAYVKVYNEYALEAKPQYKKCNNMVIRANNMLDSYFSYFNVHEHFRNYQILVFCYKIALSYPNTSIVEIHKWAREDAYQQQMISIANRIAQTVEIMKAEMNAHFEKVHNAMNDTLNAIESGFKSTNEAITHMEANIGKKIDGFHQTYKTGW